MGQGAWGKELGARSMGQGEKRKLTVSKKSEIITARFAKKKSQGSQRHKLQMINFAILAKP
jgi:hypothetical protein